MKLKQSRLLQRLIILVVLILLFSADGSAQSTWTLPLCPVTYIARRQVIRQLGKLSRNLHDLAIEKQELSESSGPPNVEQVNVLKDSVRRLRANIDRLTPLYTASDRQRGVQVGNSLYEDMNEKMDYLGSAPIDRNLLERGAREALSAKARVDTLISEIEMKPCTQ